MKNDTTPHPFDGEPSFEDLQPYFDEQASRIADIIDSMGGRPPAINLSAATTNRRRALRAWGVLSLFFLVVSIYWGIALWHLVDDIYVRIFSIFLEVVFIVIATKAIVTIISILRRSPYRCRDTRGRFLMTRYSPHSLGASLLSNATIGFAASIFLVIISATTTVGDGLFLTKNMNQDTRIETIETIEYTLNHMG